MNRLRKVFADAKLRVVAMREQLGTKLATSAGRIWTAMAAFPGQVWSVVSWMAQWVKKGFDQLLDFAKERGPNLWQWPLFYIARRAILIEAGIGLIIVLLGLGVAFFTYNTFLSTNPVNPPQATVSAMSDDKDHHIVAYLCIPKSGDTVTGTVMLTVYTSYVYMDLPAPGSAPDVSNSFPVPNGLRTSSKHPDCIGDESLIETYLHRLATEEGVSKDELVCYSTEYCFPLWCGNPPKECTSSRQWLYAAPNGFQTVIRPAHYQKAALEIRNFSWQHAVQRRSWTNHIIRLNFPGFPVIRIYGGSACIPAPSGTGCAGQNEYPDNYEKAVEVVVLLPPGATPVNVPTASVTSNGPQGVSVVAVTLPATSADQTVQIEWQDSDALDFQNRTLLAAGLVLGLLGALFGNLFFTRPRLVKWLEQWQLGRTFRM